MNHPQYPLIDPASDLESLVKGLVKITCDLQAHVRQNKPTVQTHRIGLTVNDEVRLQELPALEPLPPAGLYMERNNPNAYCVSVVNDMDAPLGLVSFTYPVHPDTKGTGWHGLNPIHGLMDPVNFNRLYKPYETREGRSPLIAGHGYYDSKYGDFLAYVKDSVYDPDEMVTFLYPYSREIWNEQIEYRPLHSAWEGKMTAATFLRLFPVKKS